VVDLEFVQQRLQGDAELWQDQNHIRSPQIVYDMARDRVEAQGGADAGNHSNRPGRVEIILQPETGDTGKAKDDGQ